MIQYFQLLDGPLNYSCFLTPSLIKFFQGQGSSFRPMSGLLKISFGELIIDILFNVPEVKSESSHKVTQIRRLQFFELLLSVFSV